MKNDFFCETSRFFTVVVQAFRPAVSGGPEDPHYDMRGDFSQALE
jgi:hypothetical protein